VIDLREWLRATRPSGIARNVYLGVARCPRPAVQELCNTLWAAASTGAADAALAEAICRQLASRSDLSPAAGPTAARAQVRGALVLRAVLLCRYVYRL
jgi:hypothetical protein